ncbi:MAG: DUF1353 domain-containing protein [Patescibacteria group bacterium]|nr:DUF1353 domain-containing protein [Patescibacteria group bacterium]
MGWIQIGDFRFIPPDYEKVRIIEHFIYEYEGVKYTAPAKQVTDGISVPDIFKSLVDGQFKGRSLPAAFIHDRLCHLGLTGRPVCSWADCHKIFYRAMLDNGVPKGGRKGAWLKYQAVRIGMMFRRWKY